MPSSATGVGMPICLLGGVLLILTQKNSQKFGDVLGIMSLWLENQVQTLEHENAKRIILTIGDEITLKVEK